MKQDKLSKPMNVLLLALVATFLWGCAPSFIKTGYSLLHIESYMTESILLFAGCRFTLAGIMVICIQSILNKKMILPEKGSLKSICVLALFQTFCQYFVYYMGVARTSGVNAAIITGLGALFVLLLSVYVFKTEKMRKNKIGGCIIGFIGILFMNIASFGSSTGTIQGDLLIVCSNMCYAVSACFMGIFSKKHSSVMLSGYQFLLGGICLMLVGKVFGGSVEFTSLACYLDLLYLGIISAVAYTVWGILLAHNPASKIGIYGCFTPVFGVLVSAVLLNEWKQALSLGSLVALVMIVIAVYIVNYEKRELS